MVMGNSTGGPKSAGLDPGAQSLGPLSPWAPELAEAFVKLATDIALVIGENGIIERVAQAGAEPLNPAANEWVGRPWIDTVTAETRGKAAQLLTEASQTGVGRRREINHPSSGGDSIPVSYSAIRLGVEGPLLAVGRDLRSITAIQQRFLEAQREAELSYWRARQGEARYQELFRVAHDAVALVDIETLQIVEANEAAAKLFDLPLEDLPNRMVVNAFEKHSRRALEELLRAAQASGQQSEVRLRLAQRALTASVAAVPFRQHERLCALLRIRPLESNESLLGVELSMARMVDEFSDAVIVTKSNGRILGANRTFQDLVHADEAGILGRSLRDWLGLADGTFDQILERVRQSAVLRDLTGTIVLGLGQVVVVRISAHLLTDSDEEHIGFVLRRVPVAHRERTSELIPSPNAWAIRLGAEPLPELLERASRTLELQLITRALSETNGDLDATARLLGIDPTELARRRSRLFAAAPRDGEP